MKLYLLRHGEAAALAASDSERPLTDRGRHETEQVISRANLRMEPLEAIFASPKLRAKQTSKIAAEGVLGRLKPIETNLLKPGASIEELTRFLDRSDLDSVLLVTHQPLVGKLIDYLTDKPGTGNAMGTSCLACLDIITLAQGCGSLEWLETP